MINSRSGKIILRLVKGGTPEPIFNAAVTVGRFHSSQLYLTDSGGRVEFTVDAPQTMNTQNPTAVQRPYAICDLKINAPGMKEITVIGCQVFAGVTTLLDCEVNKNNEEKTIRIPVHKIWAENPNSSDAGIYIENYTAESDIPFVSEKNKFLKKDTYPDFITVHLGRATETAADITISFKQYIKNIASFLFYPTWQDSVLRENIQLLIDNAKKRIQSGYYRSSGYPFDMAAEKDLIYCDGRMLFEPICRNTDALLESNRSNGSPSVFREELKKGCCQSEVRTLQERLNRVSVLIPSIPVIADAEGCFGRGTEASVKAYQRYFRQPVNGIVDQAIWQSICFVSETADKYRDLHITELTTGNTDIDNVLVYGDEGSEVVKLQHSLNCLSRKLGEKCVPAVNISGSFNDQTRDSINKYQKYKKIPQSGVADKATWSFINDDCNGFTEESTIAPAEKEYPGSPVVKGSEGEEVYCVQNRLRIIKDIVYGTNDFEADGVFGEDTEKAVQEIQKLFGLNDVGIVDEYTWKALETESNRIIKTKPQTGSSAVG